MQLVSLKLRGWRYIVSAFVMMAITLAGIISTLSLLQKEAISTHQNIAKLHARTFEENFAQILENIDRTITRIPFLSNQESTPEVLHNIFADVLQNAPYIRSFSLLDEQGIILASSNLANISHSVDMENFLPIPFGAVPLLRIGVPWEGRDFNVARPSTIAHPIRQKSINFIPIIKKVTLDKQPFYLVATLNTDYFANRYTSSLPPEDGIVSLWRMDGILLFSTNAALQVGSSHFNDEHQNEHSDFFEHLQALYHTPIGALRLAQNLPFVVDITMNQDVALRYWEEERNKVLWVITLLISLSGLLGLILFLRYSKEAERQKEQLSYEKQFRLAMEATRTGLWTWNYKTNAVTWDKQCYLLLDYEPDAFVPSIELIYSLTHVDDASKVLSSIKEQIKASSSFIAERRIKTAKEEWRWVQIRGKVIEFASNGEPLLLTGVYIDIDAQKQAEELRISAVAFDSQNAIAITDVHAKILKVNHAFTKITGYSSEEVIGKNPSILQSGKQDKTFYEKLWGSLLKEGFWQGEIWNKRKNGEIYAEHITITAIKDEEGKTSHFLANFNDITAHKIAHMQTQERAYSDPLTRLANRHLLEENLLKALCQTSNNSNFGALIFLDLDHFKQLNDTHGHDAGDILLVQVAQRLQACTRKHDTVARLGGDEFVILLENIGPNEKEVSSHVNAIALKILALINEPFSLTHGNYSLSVSIGITLYGKNPKNPQELLKEADVAMYQAKEKGRNQICFFKSS